MKRLKKHAAEGFQLNRTYELFLNAGVTDEDIVAFAGLMHSSWENANAEGYIEESYDSIEEWLKDYVSAVSQDVIDAAKKDEEFMKNYALLNDEDKEKFLDMVNDYVLSKQELIVEKV